MKMYHVDESGISIIDTSGPANTGPVAKIQDGIQRDVLLSALRRALQVPAVQSPTNWLNSEHLIIQNKQVIAYVGDIVISIPLGINTGLEVTVLATSLCKVLMDIPEDTITLQFNQDGYLVIQSESTKASVVAQTVEADILRFIGSPHMDGLKEEDWQDLPEEFDEAVGLCMFGASPDIANVAYNSLHVLTEQIQTTDNWRISRYLFPNPKAGMDFLIPIKSAEELLGCEVVQVQATYPWAHFRDVDGLVFSARIVHVPFPNGDQFFDLIGVAVKLPTEIVKALEAVLVFAPGEVDEMRRAELHFMKDKVVCIAQNDKGRIERTVPATGMQPPPNIPMMRINPLFFIEILKHVTDMKVGKGGKRVLFRAGNFEHVMNLPRK